MTHEFSHDPIKIRVLDLPKGITKQTYVFVGTVPKDVRKELQRLENNINLENSPVLKKFYGINWKAKLGVKQLIKKGGAEFEIDEDLLDELGDISLETGNVQSETTVEEQTPTEIEESDYHQVDELLDLTQKIDFLTEKEETLAIQYAGGVQFITDINVSPSDNILEFKYKIYAAIGIPIYRQHVWFKYHHRSYPLNYVTSIHKHIENIDIERLITFYQTPDESTGIDSIDGIPVEIEYYNSKDFLHISARDPFELLHNIYYKYATNEFYLVDLNDLIDANEIYTKHNKDTYQLELIYYGFITIYFPMITYSIFREYIKNEKSIRELYPGLLPDKKRLQALCVLENSITTEAYTSVDDAKLQKKLFSSIIATTISLNDVNQDIDVVLSLRNLFDTLVLDNTMTYCKANLLHENQNVILRKSYMNEREPRDIIPINSLMIKIRINEDTNENMRMVIFKNGNYIIKTEWREENHMDFKKITKIAAEKINPIVNIINKLGDQVKYHKIDITQISTKNVAFTETSLAFYFDDDTTEARFNIFKNVLEDYKNIGLITQKESSILGLEFFFNKGMYKYDPNRIEKVVTIENYYEFLSNGLVKQKWDSVFTRTRLFQIINISGKLKITVSGIRDDIELEYFHMYLSALLSIYIRSAAHIKVETSETVQTKTKKALKNLKSQDPVLYNFKKLYNSDVIYSKICQKPYQPVILSDEEYTKLPKDKKSKALKYWNFTKQKPVWYSCPNIKYPYIKFIVKQHPRDFCIPCCKKIEMNENVNKKKQEIHNTCLVKHEYTGEKVNITKGSRYIASYGKNIEPGRISRLPENTLEPLFFDTYSSEGGLDQECITADGYYLFGVTQRTSRIDDVGMLYALAHALNRTVKELLIDVCAKIKKQPDNFRVILDGNANMYFKDVNEMCDLLVELDDENALESDELEYTPWNLLIISIAYYYLGINIILFSDATKEAIELILPKGLRTPTEMFPESHTNLVILQKKTKYYPIYLFNTEIFKRTGIIDTKLFLNDSGLITIIRAIVRRHFETQDYEKIKANIDLVTIKEFCSEYGINIKHHYINYSNLCYAVVLEYKKQNIYFPIFASHYPLEKNISLLFTPYKGEYNASFVDLHKIIALFKKWNVEQSAKNKLEGLLLYPDICVQQWLLVSNSIIGFLHNNINYFIKEVSEAVAKKLDAKPIQTMLYHPYEINALIYSVKQGKISTSHLEEHTNKLNHGLYDFYLYNIVLMYYISIFNDQRNTALRSKLSAILAKTDFNKDLSKVREFIDTLDDEEDKHKIKNIISRYVADHHDKKKMINDVREAYFNFDKISLEKLRGLSNKEIIKELTSLAGKFTKIGKPKITKFPNIFGICNKNTKTGYCYGDKLIIEKKRLEEIINILASEVANPAKWKWLFNSVFINKTVDFFRFIRRKNETITLEFV